MSLLANGFERLEALVAQPRRLITQERDGYVERAARATLTRLRELMQQPKFKDYPEAQSFLREAETLIESGGKQ